MLAHDKIEVLWNTEVKEIHGIEGNRRRERYALQQQDRARRRTSRRRACLSPSVTSRTRSLFKGILDMDDVGYLKTEGRTMKTNIPGVFACGDAQDSYYRQAVTAAGTGCMAAIDAERFLVEHHTRRLRLRRIGK